MLHIIWNTSNACYCITGFGSEDFDSMLYNGIVSEHSGDKKSSLQNSEIGEIGTTPTEESTSKDVSSQTSPSKNQFFVSSK